MHFLDGRVGFIYWMTKHYGGHSLNYVQNMPTPHEYYVEEAAQAEGRVQWSLQGLTNLTTELIHYPMDDEHMGCKVEYQVFVPVEERPNARQEHYREYVHNWYDTRGDVANHADLL